MQQHTRTVVALAATALAVLAGSSAHAQAKAEVMHWWTSGGESAAVQELAGAFTKSGGVWVDSAVAGGENARAAAINRIVGGNPPTAAMFNTSQQYLDIIKEGMLNDIDAVAAKEGWDKMLPAPIINSIKVNGHYYAAPVNIHMPSWFWYSKAAFAKAGIAAEPKTPDEMFAALDKLKAAGLIPVAHGGQNWQDFTTFESVVLGVGGAKFYQDAMVKLNGDALNSPTMRKSLETFRRIKTYTDPAASGRDWNLATAMLIQGKAGFQLMGDWAKGEFIAAGKTPGKDFMCAAAPGTTTSYTFNVDSFILFKLKDASAQKAQSDLASSIMSPEFQEVFNLNKGSIPVRAGQKMDKFDDCAKASAKDFADTAKSGSLLPSVAHGMAIAPATEGAIKDAVSQFWNDDKVSVADAMKKIATAAKTK